MKILKSLFVVLVVAALTAGATGAYFSDQESITGNTFATGTLDITLNHSSGKPWSVTNAYPGYTSGWEHMDIFNSPGTLPVEAYLWMSQTGGSGALYNNLWIDLYDSGWDSTCGNGDDVLIYSGYLSLLSNPPHRIQTSDKDPNASGTPGNDDIRPGKSQRVCQRLSLPASAPNSLQGLSTTFTEWVDAEQNDD